MAAAVKHSEKFLLHSLQSKQRATGGYGKYVFVRYLWKV